LATAALVLGGKTGVIRGPSPAVLGSIALAGGAAAACSVSLAHTSDHVDEPGVQATLMVWMVLSYVVTGLVAWWRRPGRFGPLMIVAGFAIFVPSLSWSNVPGLYTIGITFDLVPAVLFMHVFLAFPSGRLEWWIERALVVAGYLTAFGLQLIGMTLGAFGPDNLLAVVSEPDAAETLQRVQLVVLAAVALAGIGILFVHRRSGGRPLRRSAALLVDSFALGLAMIAFLFLSAAFGLVEGDLAFETIRRATFFVIGLAPLAFLAGLLQARFLRSGVGELFIELRANPAPADLRDALARALRDPSLSLAYWLPDFDAYTDLDGRPVNLPSGDDHRAVTLVERHRTPVAALIHDPSLRDERELLDSVAAAAGITLENARLHAELSARVEELAGSRARVIQAGQRERQRLERNLHDGAQQRLVALSLELSLLHEQLDGDAVASMRIDQARSQIAISLGELRDVARGIHPAVVSGHGLAVALEELATNAPVPVRLTVDIEERLPESIEVAAYYVVCESLANVGKHARATLATIGVVRENGRVVVEVVDDGIGGADTERGSGLRGLADRVEALGGRLQVWTPGGVGTRVRAEMPCAS
jgi:signal transduction histidine kinase